MKYLVLGAWTCLGNKKLTSLIKGPTMLIALLTIVLSMACGGQSEPVVAASDEDTMVKIVTVRSVVDPVPGHENHQLAILIPPDTRKVYTGTLSYNATKPVDVVVLLPYNPPGDPSETHGSLETFDAGAYQLFSSTNIEMGKFATLPFSGAGLALHTLNGDPFEATASIRAVVEDQTKTE